MKRRTISDAPSDDRYIVMHFADGAVIDPRKCESNILARTHWAIDPNATGTVNTVCRCATSPAATSEAQDKPTCLPVGSTAG